MPETFNITKAIESLAGDTGFKPSTDTKTLPQLAQEQNQFAPKVDTTDSFWSDEAIDPQRWNKQYPYQILVLDAANDYSKVWEFTLPIPPEALTISLPFASTVSATLDGIVEEHGGAPFRLITLQGTTGVFPTRPSAAADNTIPDQQAFGLFSGTIQTAQNVAGTFNQQIAAQPGGNPLGSFNLIREGAFSAINLDQPNQFGRGTGYFQFHLLRMFLEGYANLKKKPQGKQYRLALAIWKDQAQYIVTPQNFELRRSAAQSPLEYSYTLQMKAWKRLKINSSVGEVLPTKNRADKTTLQTILGAISDARDFLEGSRSVISAVVADIAAPFEILRQSTLLLKDAVGVGLALTDLPDSIKTSLTGAISAQTSATNSLYVNAIQLQSKITAALIANNSIQGAGSTNSSALSATEQMAKLQGQASPVAKVFGQDINKNYATLSKININNIQLKPAIRKLIQDELTRTRRLQRQDFERMRDQIQSFMADYADGVGAGSNTYNDIFGRHPKPTNKTPTDRDFQILWAMNQTIQELSRLSISLPQASQHVKSIDNTAEFARRSSIAFTVPTSKFSIPYPYGVTLERLAGRYLGDPNRWMEIATLNGLREPFVDEVGFDLPLLTNGVGNQVVVSSAQNLYVGQAVTLRSIDARPVKKRITRIEMFPNTATIYLDGTPVDSYTTAGQATVHAFLPDTVNSQSLIWIPSNLPVAQDLTTRSIPGLLNLPGTIDRGGVDLLVTQSGDAAITPDGDWKLAVGLTNLTQRVRTAFATPKGSLPQHPTYGLGLTAGANIGDTSAEEILIATTGMFADDADFAGVNAARVKKDGNSLTIRLDVSVAGEENLLPVSLEVLR